MQHRCNVHRVYVLEKKTALLHWSQNKDGIWKMVLFTFPEL